MHPVATDGDHSNAECMLTAMGVSMTSKHNVGGGSKKLRRLESREGRALFCTCI